MSTGDNVLCTYGNGLRLVVSLFLVRINLITMKKSVRTLYRYKELNVSGNSFRYGNDCFKSVL